MEFIGPICDQCADAAAPEMIIWPAPTADRKHAEASRTAGAEGIVRRAIDEVRDRLREEAGLARRGGPTLKLQGLERDQNVLARLRPMLLKAAREL